ncbi:MAG: hypothetical protein LBT61_01645 [Prevotellaceae bacterium]|jgi:hypothetical protein|nr:hypothetical protein [Prevotellaceae bacterium]
MITKKMHLPFSVLRWPLAVLLIALAIAGCKKDDDKTTDTPPLAASTQTWTFGDQTWSDAIQCPECNRKTFEESDTEPQCRNYADAESGKTFYYYNWPYVDANKNTMCPSPWRVPTRKDFDELVGTACANLLGKSWGYGGYAEGSSLSLENSEAAYWSNTEMYGYTNDAYYMFYHRIGLGVHAKVKDVGMQVRCVK